MRQILKSTYLKRFSTIPSNNLSSIIDFKMKQLRKIEDNDFNLFSNMFLRLYIKDLRSAKTIRKHAQRMQTYSLSTANSVQKILYYFQQTSKRYQEKYLVEVMQNLAKAVKINHLDNWSSFDKDSYQLHLLPVFDHLVEQIKYSLRKDVFISFTSLRKILNSLYELNYVDDQIIQLVIEKINKKINEQNKNSVERPFQAQKRGYFQIGLVKAYESLSKNENFAKSLQIIATKLDNKKYEEAQIKQIEKLNDNSPKNIIIEIIQTIHNLNHNVESLVEAIISLRQQYRKMRKRSALKSVLADYQLNINLLQIEEQLLDTGLIDYSDIINSQYSHQVQRGRVQQITNKILSDFRAPIIEPLLTTPKVNQVQKIQKIKSQQLRQVSQVYLSLTKLATLPCILYKNPSGITLISLFWQNSIIKSNNYLNHIVPAERIFRKSFKDVYNSLRVTFQKIQTLSSKVFLEDKIQWIESLCNIGLFDQAISVLNTIVTKDIKGQKFQKSLLISLLQVFNNIGKYTSTKWNALQIYQFIQKKIFPNKHLENLQMSQICKILNFLHLFCQKTSDNSKFYSNLLDDLAEKVKIRTNNPFLYRELIQPYRILSLERPQLYFLQDLHYQQNDKKYRDIEEVVNQKQFSLDKQINKTPTYYLHNPFKKPLVSTCEKYLKTQIQNLGFLPSGFKSPESQILTGLYVADSQQSSINGKYVNGDLQAYFSRIKKIHNTQLSFLSVNQLLNINYQQNTIEMKKQQEVQKVLKAKLYKSDNIINNLVIHLTKTIESIYNKETNFQQNKITFLSVIEEIKMIAVLYKNQKLSIVFDHFLAQRSKLVLSLVNFKQNLISINQKALNLLNSQHQKLYNIDLLNLIDNTTKQLAKGLSQISQKHKNIYFSGKRQTIQTLSTIQKIGNIKIELMNSVYFNDKTYVQYEDWAKLLNQQTSYTRILLNEASPITNLLVKTFCPQVKDYIQTIPRLINNVTKNVPYPLNWQTIYTNNLTEQQTKSINNLSELAQKHQNLKNPTKQLKILIKLLNFKQWIKTSMNIEEACQYILKFSFIKTLMREKIKNKPFQKEINHIKRNSIQYFNYLEHKYDRLYNQSPYMEYILQKMSHIQNLKEALQNRKDQRIKSKILYQNGKINRKQYKGLCQKIDKQVVQKMQQIHKKTLENSEDMIVEPGLKMVHLKKDYEQFSNLFKRNDFYVKQLDKDVIESNGNYDQALMRKKCRAENNLIKMYLILKMYSPDEKLNQEDQQYLKIWKQNLGNKNNEFSFTNLKISDLDIQDKEKLILSRLKLEGEETNLSLSEVILQLNHFFDERVIFQIQRNLSLQKLAKEIKVPKEIFQFSSNKQFTILSLQKQREIFDNMSKLNTQDLKDLKTMASILKVQSPFVRKRFDQIYDNFQNDVQILNSCPQRIELISSYFERKENQFNKNQDLKLSQNMKNSSIEQIWSSVFTKTPRTQLQMSKMIFKICSRFYILRKNLPPYFGAFILKILEDPLTDHMARQNLIANLQLYKVPLTFDSSDIVRMGHYTVKKLPQKRNFIKEMKQIANKNFSKEVSNKITLL